MRTPGRLTLVFVVCTAWAQSAYATPVAYWNVFNIEGESSVSADIVTYASLADMLHDSNRASTNTVPGFFARNIVDSGSDGVTYWDAALTRP